MNEFIEIGINNSYLIMTGKLTVEELIEYKSDSIIFFTSPENYTIEDIDEMIKYFENTEEYEKCNELSHCRNILDLDIFLENLRIKNGTTNY